jgi:membrane protease YdiL (CAAX protease family)
VGSITAVSKSVGAKRKHGKRPSRGVQLIEVSVFLFLIVPSMALSFFVVKQGNLSFVLTAVSNILRDLGLVGLILFFLWRNGEPITRIGWTFRNVRKEIALGLWFFIPLFYGMVLLEQALQAIGLSVSSTSLPSFLAAKGIAQFLLASLLVVVVAAAEETIFRGYLLLRLKAVTTSPAAAVVLSAAIFSLGHGYEGSAGVVTIGAMGLVLALIYLWRQSLIAPMVMHFLQDFIGIVLLPMLGMK